MNLVAPLSPDLFKDVSIERHDQNDETSPQQEQRSSGYEQKVSVTLTPGQALEGTGFRIRRLEDKSVYSRYTPKFQRYMPEERHILKDTVLSDLGLSNIELTSKDITRWRMAWRAAQRLMEWDESPQYIRGDAEASFTIERLLVPRCKELSNLADNLFEIEKFLGLSIATVVYGGLHALAWSANFETSTEQLLWRISSCTVMTGLPLFALLIWSTVYTETSWHDSKILQTMIGLAIIICRCVTFILLILLPIAYVLARAFLVVECFINLSHLPAEVYDVPSWSSYFPHIS